MRTDIVIPDNTEEKRCSTGIILNLCVDLSSHPEEQEQTRLCFGASQKPNTEKLMLQMKV